MKEDAKVFSIEIGGKMWLLKQADYANNQMEAVL